MTVLAVFRHLLFALALALVSALVVRAMINVRVMDLPNDRSAHAVPTPRGGGMGIVVAFLLGAIVLAIPLIRTSRLKLVGDTVMMHRSASFFVVMIVLGIIRILAHSYLDTVMSVQQTAGLFFILAFGMILHWRTNMLFEYRRVTSGRLPE